MNAQTINAPITASARKPILSRTFVVGWTLLLALTIGVMALPQLLFAA